MPMAFTGLDMHDVAHVDLALFMRSVSVPVTQLAVLTAQTGQLGPLRLRKPIIAAASITFGLAHPIPDRLRRWLELA